MPKLARLEVWGDLQCAGGSRLAVLPAVAAASDTRRVAGDESLVVAVPRVGPGTDQLQERRILRPVFVDGSFDEWRIQSIDERRDAGPLMLVTGSWPSQDLRDTAVVTRTEVDGLVRYNFEALGLTISQHLTSYILPAMAAEGATWFAAGTITPTEPVDLVYDWTTPWEALMRLAEGRGELQLRRNGTSGYLIDIVDQVGSGATALALRLGRNLTGVARSRDTADQATRIHPRGGDVDGIRATMRRARWKVTAVDTGADDVTLADPVGGDGPLLRDDQLNGRYLRRVDGTLDQILDSFAATQKVRVADASFYAVNQLVEVRKTSLDEDLDFLEDPAAKSIYGAKGVVIDRPETPETVNLCPNPSMRAWSGGSSTPPDSWTKLGTPTLTKTTTTNKWRVGGQSCRVQSTADGQGLEVDVATVAPSTASPYFSGFISVLLASGQVRVELVANDGSISRVIPSGTEKKAWTNVVDVWIDLGVAGIDLNALDAGSTTAKLRVVQDGDGTADFYVDGAQITQTAGQQPYIEGSGGTQLWQEANRELERNAYPSVRYDVEVLDLNRLHPTVWPTQEMVKGQTVNVVDPEMGVSGTTRALEVTRDLLAAADTKVVLSNRPEEMTDTLVRPNRPRRLARNADASPDPVVSAFYQRVNGAPYQIQVALSAVPPGAAIYKWVGLSTDTIPIVGSLSYTGYTMPFNVALDMSTTANAIVAAYAVIAGRTSPVQLFQMPFSPAPAAPMTLSEPVAGTLRVAWAPNAWVRRVDLYVRKHASNWPTLDGTSTGVLDPTYKVRQGMSINADGGAQGATGTPVAGGTLYESTGWAGSDVARVILVPIDELDNLGGRETSTRTMTGAVTPAITSINAIFNSDGSSCSAGAVRDFAWTPTGGVVDGTHELRVYITMNGGTPVLMFTETSPASVTSRTGVTLNSFLGGYSSWNQGSGTSYVFEFTYQLRITSSGIPVDSGYIGNYTPINSCLP